MNRFDRALEISKKFPFTPYQPQTEPPASEGTANGTVAPQTNHLDEEFMESLKRGDHLDVNKMPL